MIALSFKLDTTALQKWAEKASRDIPKNLRGAVDRSARHARKMATAQIAADANLAPADFRKANPPVKTSTFGGPIEATWTPGVSSNFVRTPGGQRQVVKRYAGTIGSTFKFSGGGSANLALPKAFSIRSINSSQNVFIRIGKERKAIKGVYAATPRTEIRDERDVPHHVWLQEAEHALA